MGVVGPRNHFFILGSIISLERVKLNISNVVCRLIMVSNSVHMTDYPQVGCVQSHTISKFWETTDISETVHVHSYNGRLVGNYRLSNGTKSMTLSYLNVTLAVWNPFSFHTSAYSMCWQRRVYTWIAKHRWPVLSTVGLLKSQADWSSHVRRKVRRHYYRPLIGSGPMAYWIAPFPVTFCDLEGHWPIASLCNGDFSYSCTAVDKI